MLKALFFYLTNPKAKRTAEQPVKQVRPILNEAMIHIWEIILSKIYYHSKYRYLL